MSAATQTIPRKRWTRVLLCLLGLYIINFIDRNNLGFAVIGGMNEALGIGTAESGLAGGLFFLGYIILQVPSGILVEKYDANRLIMLLSIAWGVVAMATGLVRNGTELLILRFLLGLIDGGVWTMILVVLARWFPENERSTSNGVWLLCLPLSFIAMGPLSGALLSHFDWRMLFVLQGLPAVVLGIVYYMSAASRPQDAAWLSREERDYILAGQQNPGKKASAQDYKNAILNPQVLLMSAVYGFWLIGATGLFMWIPAIIKTLSGAGVTYISYVSTLPYITAMVGLLVAGRISDKTMYKNRVVAIVLLGLGVFLLLSVLVQNSILSLAFLVLSGTFLFAAHAPFWAIAAEHFPPQLRGSAMGMISLLGNLGAFVGPYTVGYINEKTGSFSNGILLLVASLGIAAVLATQIRVVGKRKGSRRSGTENRVKHERSPCEVD